MNRICIIVAGYFNYYKGGAELQAKFIAEQLAKSVEVYYLFVRPPSFKKEKIQSADGKIILYPMKRYEFKMFGKFFFLNYWELIRLLDEINPDLIYQRGGKPYIGMVTKWCQRNNKKSVLGLSMECNCSQTQILNLDKNFFTYPSKVVNSCFTFYGFKKTDLIIAQNQKQQQLIQKNFNRDSIIITNGLYVPSPPFKKADPLIISWIANIKELKQPEIFIKLAENCKDLNVQFVYAGRPAGGSYQKMLLEKTNKLSNLKYLGEIPYDDTNELLSKSSLFVNTSTTEGFSNTYIQAWMRENPVVTLNCDPDDLIKKHKIGFHSGSFEQLVRDVRSLIENENVRRDMGEKAREHAIKNYDIEKIGRRYLNTFMDLISSE